MSKSHLDEQSEVSEVSYAVTVFSADAEQESRWIDELKVVTGSLPGFDSAVISGSRHGGEMGQLLFVDETMPELKRTLLEIEERGWRKGRAVFLIVDEDSQSKSQVLDALADGRVDDVLVFPFRPLELLSKLGRYQQILMWDEVSAMNASFNEVISRLQEDLQLTERLQKAKLPVRFPEVKGFTVKSRYIAGAKSGGDYFDIADSRDESWMSIVMSDSSSYGLSSSVLSVLMSVMVKLSASEMRSCADTVKRIQDELMLTLNVRDHLSLFYATLSRKDYVLRYLNLGTGSAFYAPPGRDHEMLKVHGNPMTRMAGRIQATESELVLEPGGRFVLLSDGFLDAAGGPTGALELLNRFRKKESIDAINEFTYLIKGKLTGPDQEDELPPQDCTGMILEMDGKVLRLA